MAPKGDTPADRHPVLFAAGFGGLIGFLILAVTVWVVAGFGSAVIWLGLAGLAMFVGTGVVSGVLDARAGVQR